MQIITPENLTDTEVIYSNLTEADYPVWAAGTTYAVGARVISTFTHRIYESVIAANLGNDPTTDDGTNWLNVSATNKWRAFDLRITDKTVNPLKIEYKFSTTSVINGLAMFGLDAASVQVIATSALDGEVYNKTVSLVDNSMIYNLYDYFFEPIERWTEYVFNDLPNYADTEIDVILTSPSGDVSVGQLVVGQQRTIGDIIAGTTVSILDYSTNAVDGFGNVYVVPRAWSDTVDYKISVDTSRIGHLRRLLAQYHASPVVWFEDTNGEVGTTVLGYYTSFDEIVQIGPKSDMNLNVRGLV